MLLRELKQEHAKHLKAIKALDAKEELSEAESQELETRMTECESLAKKIERRHKLERLDLKTIETEIPRSEKRSYSFAKAIECLIKGKTHSGSYEAECHQELEKRTKSGGGFLVPSQELFGRVGPPEKRIVDNQSALVSDPIKAELYLPALFEQSIIGSLGVRRISATGSFNFPRSSKTTAGWISGDGGDDAADKLSEQDQTFTKTSVEPHFLGAITGWSLRQLKQMAGNLSLEGILRSNLVQAMAEKLDDSLVNSDNSTATQNPLGLLKALGATTNNKTLDYSTTVGWTWSVLTELKQQLREQYKNNMMSPKFLIGPQIEKEWSDKQRFASSDGRSLLQEAPGQVIVSSHLKNTSVLFGQWSEFMVVTFNSVELSLGMIDDDFQKGNQRLRAIGCFDFVLNRKEGFRQLTITR